MHVLLYIYTNDKCMFIQHIYTHTDTINIYNIFIHTQTQHIQHIYTHRHNIYNIFIHRHIHIHTYTHIQTHTHNNRPICLMGDFNITKIDWSIPCTIIIIPVIMWILNCFYFLNGLVSNKLCRK